MLSPQLLRLTLSKCFFKKILGTKKALHLYRALVAEKEGLVPLRSMLSSQAPQVEPGGSHPSVTDQSQKLGSDLKSITFLK